MRPFAALERFFERIFERPSARLFHAKLQPIQLQRRVERAMENGRLNAGDRVVVPNRYLVRLSGADLRAFGDLADSLELELADAALRFARAHRYSLSDRPAVRLIDDPTVDAGDVRVEASFSDTPPVPPGQPSHPPQSAQSAPSTPAPDDESPPEPYGAGADAAPSEDAHEPEPEPQPAPVPSGIRADGHPRAAAASSGRPPVPAAAPAAAGAAPPRPAPATPAAPAKPAPAAVPAPPPAIPVRNSGYNPTVPVDVTRTMVFAVPTLDIPLAVLREVGPDGSQRQLTLDGGPVTIGRATDNTLVLHDGRVSRYHGRLTARQGALVYSDVGSTNGSRVNGVEVDEVVLGAGDRIELGDTILVVESVANG